MRAGCAKAALLAACLLCATVATAAAGQLDPTTKPTTKGPISLDDQSFAGPQCSRKEQKTNGELNAVTRLCAFFYRFDPNSESDAAHDYGVWWIQSSITPKNHWCATSVTTDLALKSTSPFEMIKAAPNKEVDATATTKVIAKLVVDAGGNATTDAVVRQHFLLYPAKLVPRLSKKAHSLKLKWVGASRHTLAFAGGAEVEWDPSSTPPGVTPNLSTGMAKGSACG